MPMVYFQLLIVPSVLFYVVESTLESRPVTADAAVFQTAALPEVRKLSSAPPAWQAGALLHLGSAGGCMRQVLVRV